MVFDEGAAHGRMGVRDSGGSARVRRREDDLVDSGHDAEGTTVEVDSGGLADASNAATAGSDDALEVPAELSEEDRAERLTQLNGIIELMRPAVQADGGDLALVSADVASGVIEVQLQGACSSCAVSSSTLQGGVERILHDRLPWVTEVLGGVDESVDPFESESMGRGGYVPSF
jgi:Fe-S cluster biogenesis protein NfuA